MRLLWFCVGAGVMFAVLMLLGMAIQPLKTAYWCGYDDSARGREQTMTETLACQTIRQMAYDRRAGREPR